MANSRIGMEISGSAGEQFRIDTFLDNGAFGEVYKVTGVKSGAVAVVKMVPLSKLRDRRGHFGEEYR